MLLSATERHETCLLSAGTINKREHFHKGNKDMDVLCSARSCCAARRGAARLGAASIGTPRCLCGGIGALICCQSADRATVCLASLTLSDSSRETVV